MQFLFAIGVIYVVITISWTIANLESGEFQPISIYWPLWIILVLPVICIKDLWKRTKEVWKS